MTHDERIKFAYKTMLVNNPDEAVKVLIMQDKQLEDLRNEIDKVIKYLNNLYENEYISYGTKEEMLNILRGVDNE